ncbi:TonB-dependent receptor [Sphingobium cloacae]|uniref:TonB-dependent Receptor Plug domain protein n=1 Tax=Sphingobium cloacae TaxID=120107 RepID=A0A1E1F173_9SPHN|nr:TonB-dependent receptor [Sphingobium cloacae]BAV64267.1 TonB-dependent Receptor Plug domain protein [Sphingobium cloacae]
MKSAKFKHALFALGCLSVGTAPAYAQHAAQGAQAADTGIGEIVVTANRREESLSRVPASIVAKGQLELDKQGVRSIADIAQITPGVTFGQSAVLYGTGQTSIAIRGVDSASGIPTTGVYIDDTPVQTRIGVSPSLSNPYPQVFDLERLEVLRGPQGTLFGSGSVGGAIRFILPKPEYNDVSVYGRTEIATTQHGATSYEAGLAGGAPLVEDKVGFRASVWYRHDGGYIDRLDRYTHKPLDSDINNSDTFSARLALGAKLGENLTITPSFFYQKQKIADGSRFELATSNRHTGDLKLSLNKIPEPLHDRFYLPALKMELDLGAATLVSDTSYFYRKTRSQSDDASLSTALNTGFSGEFLPGFEDYVPGTASRTKQTAFTQELRLQDNNSTDRLNWIVGAFFQKSYVRDQYAGSDPRVLELINYGEAQRGEPLTETLSDLYEVELYQDEYFVFQRNEHRDKQFAVYAQADYEIVPRVKLTAGARYTIANYKFTGFTAGPLYATNGRVDTGDVTVRNLTPKLGLSFQADRDTMLYASASKGIRGPGISPPVGARCEPEAQAIGFDPYATLRLKPDSIWSYEVGAKSRLFGGKVVIDASAYRIDWKNVQTMFNLPLCTVYAALNLGDAKIDGFDLSVTVQPIRQLTLGGSVAYTHARYTTAIPGLDGTTVRKAGEPFPRVAPWTIQLNGEFTQPVGDSEAYARADFSYSSRITKPLDLDSILVDPELPRPPATSQLDLRFGARIDAGGNSNVDLSFFINNVTNSLPLVSLYHELPGSTWYRSGTFRPRTFGVTLSVRR